MSLREDATRIMQKELDGLKAIQAAGLEFNAEATSVLDELDFPPGYTSTAQGLILGLQSQINFRLQSEIPQLIQQMEQALNSQSPPEVLNPA